MQRRIRLAHDLSVSLSGSDGVKISATSTTTDKLANWHFGVRPTAHQLDPVLSRFLVRCWLQTRAPIEIAGDGMKVAHAHRAGAEGGNGWNVTFRVVPWRPIFEINFVSCPDYGLWFSGIIFNLFLSHDYYVCYIDLDLTYFFRIIQISYFYILIKILYFLLNYLFW